LSTVATLEPQASVSVRSEASCSSPIDHNAGQARALARRWFAGLWQCIKGRETTLRHAVRKQTHSWYRPVHCCRCAVQCAYWRRR
jgi:hypothetical protein